MSIEDRVRAATRARTDLVTGIRPLELPDELPVRARRPRFARGWGGWLIPLTAAVAVIAVAATLVAVRQSRTASQPVTSTVPGTIPRYYVALDFGGLGYPGTGALIVGDDSAGKAIATVRPPHGVRFRRQGITLDPPRSADSAETEALLGEEHREVLAALRRLPPRQREAVVLRYYLDMTEAQAAQAMGVAPGTVKSATSRGLAALARMLKEEDAR